MKQILNDIKQSVLYQHKALTKAVDTCQADKFILLQNRVNLRTILINLKRLEDRLSSRNTEVPKNFFHQIL